MHLTAVVHTKNLNQEWVSLPSPTTECKQHESTVCAECGFVQKKMWPVKCLGTTKAHYQLSGFFLTHNNSSTQSMNSVSIESDQNDQKSKGSPKGWKSPNHTNNKIQVPINACDQVTQCFLQCVCENICHFSPTPAQWPCKFSSWKCFLCTLYHSYTYMIQVHTTEQIPHLVEIHEQGR